MTISSKELRLIEELERMTPEEMVYEFSYGQGSLKNNLEAISNIRKYNFPDGVMNVLIHKSFILCNNKLSSGFMEKIAEDWLANRINTTQEALEISNVHIKEYEVWAINTENEKDNHRTINVNELESTKMNAIKIAANSLEISDKALGKFVREILKS